MSQISRGPRRPVFAPNAISDPSVDTEYRNAFSRNLIGTRPKTETTQPLASCGCDAADVAASDMREFATNLVLSGNHAPRFQASLALAGTAGGGMAWTS